MTVGIAAKSEGGKAIVIMTDRLFTIGDHELKVEEPLGKTFFVTNGWLAAYAGDPTFAERVVASASTRWNALKGDDRPTFQIGVIDHFHRAYLDAYWEAVDRNVLRPRGLDIELWRRQSIKQDFDAGLRSEVEQDFAKYDEEHGCELLLCGFDPRGDAHVCRVSMDEQQHEHEWAVIGSGGDIARARLAWQRTNSFDALGRTLYEVFEATAHASGNPTVGENPSAWVMTANGPGGIQSVWEQLFTVRGTFDYEDQTPFQRLHRDGDTHVTRRDETTWEQELIEWGDKVMKRGNP